MTFPANLLASRKAAGLTIAEAAKLCKVSARTWAYWEEGKRTPPKETDAITQERIIRKLKSK